MDSHRKSKATHSRMELEEGVTICDHIQRLHHEELHDEIIFIFEIAYPMNLSSRSQRLMTTDLIILICVADAYCETDKYEKAESIYKQALVVFNHCKPTEEVFSEVEVRYRYSKCLIRIGKKKEAYDVLKVIPDARAPLKVKAVLAKLLACPWEWTEPSRSTPFKALALKSQIFKACDSALGSAASLLKANVDFGETAASIGARVQGKGSFAIKVYLNSVEMCRVRKFMDAIKELENFCDHPRIAVRTARILCKAGLDEEARKKLRSVFIAYPDYFEGMDLLARLYTLDYQHNLANLEKLANSLMKFSTERSETFVALGYLSKHELSKDQNKAKRAMYFSSRAVELAPRGSKQYIQAAFLRASVLEEMGRRAQSMSILREAIKMDSLCLDLHQSLCSALIANKDFREARNIALNFLSQMPEDPQAQLLKARTWVLTGYGPKEDLLTLLEGIVATHPHLYDAIFLLLKIYDKMQQYSKATEVLNRAMSCAFISHHKMGKIHKLFAEIMSKANLPSAAYPHVVSAMALGTEVLPGKINALELELRMEASPHQTSSADRLCPPAPRRRRGRPSAAEPEPGLDADMLFLNGRSSEDD